MAVRRGPTVPADRECGVCGGRSPQLSPGARALPTAGGTCYHGAPVPAIQLTSSAGVLRGLHDPPEGPPTAGRLRAAVVCHPHPLHGGTMDNKVVFTLARTLRERGLHVVRFNFRGAGGSEGVHDEGHGEVDDVRAALELAAGLAAGALPDEAPPPPGDAAPDLDGRLLVAGFSFGSFVGLSAALGDPRVGALLAVAPPVNYYSYPETGDFGVPLAVVWAEDDELVPARRVSAWATDGPGVDVALHPIAGATHLFHARLGPLRAAVDAFLDHVRDASGGRG